MDFNRGLGDQLAVNPIDAIEGGGDDMFTFIGTPADSPAPARSATHHRHRHYILFNTRSMRTRWTIRR